MNKIKLCVGNGHRGALNGQTGTSGTTTDGRHLSEVDFIDQVFAAIKNYIASDLSLSSKIELSYDDATVNNAKTADYAVFIHGDGSADTSVRGGFIDDNPDDQVYQKSMAFAKTVSDNFFPKIGIPYRNGQTPNSTYYYAFNETGANTKQFIIECGTMSNKQDMDQLIDTNHVGALLCAGMVTYFKVNEPIFIQNVPTPAPIDPCANIKSQLDIANKTISSLQTEMVSKLAEKDTALLTQLQAIKDKVKSFANSL